MAITWRCCADVWRQARNRACFCKETVCLGALDQETVKIRSFSRTGGRGSNAIYMCRMSDVLDFTLLKNANEKMVKWLIHVPTWSILLTFWMYGIGFTTGIVWVWDGHGLIIWNDPDCPRLFRVFSSTDNFTGGGFLCNYAPPKKSPKYR
jgi:hypothetical protein